MTLDEAAKKVFIGLGAGSDLNPYQSDGITFDTSSDGFTFILSWLNAGQRAISTWKFRNGMRVRFKELENYVDYSFVPISGTLPSGQASPYKTISLPAATGGVSNAFKDYVLTVGTESFYVLSSTTDSVTIQVGFTTDPSSKAFVLSPRHVDINTTNFPRMLSVSDVQDYTNRASIVYTSRPMEILKLEASTGQPSRFTRFGKKFVFDVAPDADLQVRAYGYFYPEPLATDPTAELALPEAFHDCIVLYALYWGYRHNEENSSMAATWANLDNMMMALRSGFEFEQEGEAKIIPSLEGI